VHIWCGKPDYIKSTSPVAMSTSPKLAIVIYTLYGHIAKMAEAAKAGVESAGGTAEIFQVAETLPQEVLTKMYAPEKPAYPVITPEKMTEFDGFLFGVSSRFGGWPAQFKTFWDSTGQLWQSGGLHGKYAGIFVGTAAQGGGQESTFFSTISTLAHHGLIFVPLGFRDVSVQLGNNNEVHGGSPFGSGTFAGSDGSRQPSALELETATIQGKTFFETVKKAF